MNRRITYALAMLLLTVCAFADAALLPSKETAAKVTHTMADLYCKTIERAAGVYVVYCHSYPVKYEDDAGTLQDIEPGLTHVTPLLKTNYYASESNALRTRIDKDGTVRTGDGTHWLETSPAYMSWDTVTVAERIVASDKLSLSHALESKAVTLTNQWLDGVTVRYDDDYGRLKETISLPTAPTIPKGATQLLVAWGYETSDGATLALVGDGAVLSADGAKALSLLPVVAVDAGGARCAGEYVLDTKAALLTACVPAKWLQTAKYPVEIDPSSEVTASYDHTLYHLDGSDRDNCEIFLQFTVPDLSGGYTITDAELEMTCYTGGSGTATAYECSNDSWNESSTASTFETISGTRGTALDSETFASGTKTWDVQGDDTKGVQGDYYDNSYNPGTTTIVLDDGTTAMSRSDGTTDTLTLGEEVAADEAYYRDRTYATAADRPILTITYEETEEGPVAPRGGMSTGVLAF